MEKQVTIVDEAKEMVKSHVEMDPGTHIAKLYSGENDTCIKLLEVSDNVATSGTVDTFYFESDLKNDITHPCFMILLSNEEWLDIQKGKLALPNDWDISLEQDLL